MSKRRLFIAGAAVALLSAFLALRPTEGRSKTARHEVRNAQPERAATTHETLAVSRAALQLRADAGGSAAPAPPARPTRLEELKRTHEQDELIWNAEQKAVRECMAERGFKYVALPYDDTDDLDHELARTDPTDVETAQEHGYGIVDAIIDHQRPKEPPAPTPTEIQQLNPEERQKFTTALLGPRVPSEAMTKDNGWESLTLSNGAQTYWYADSCYARARERIHANDYVQNELGTTRMQLEEQVSKQLETDAEYQKALEDWRACMRERGEPQAMPGAAAEALSAAYHEQKLTLEALRAREIQTATIESSCYRQTQLDARMASARARQERTLIENASDVVQGLQDAQERALARASELLGKTTVND